MVTGPIYDAKVQRLEAGNEIPDGFFKIVVDEDGQVLRMLAFMMPQTVDGDGPLGGFLVSVDRIESQTGLEFFWGLANDVEDEIEAEKAVKIW